MKDMKDVYENEPLPYQRVELHVHYADCSTRYFMVEDGWRIDPTMRTLVIGRGLNRTILPLDRIVSIKPRQTLR